VLREKFCDVWISGAKFLISAPDVIQKQISSVNIPRQLKVPSLAAAYSISLRVCIFTRCKKNKKSTGDGRRSTVAKAA
jgi:hypothetical protein